MICHYVIISPKQSLSWLLKEKCMVCPVDLYEHISNAVDTIRTALQQYKSVIYRIAGKFDELTLFEHLAKESLAN